MASNIASYRFCQQQPKLHSYVAINFTYHLLASINTENFIPALLKIHRSNCHNCSEQLTEQYNAVQQYE